MRVSFSASLLSLAQRLVVFSFYLVTDVMCYRLRMTETGIRHSAEQYGVWNRILDCYTFDMTVRRPLPFLQTFASTILTDDDVLHARDTQQHPWRTGELFDAIVTDRKSLLPCSLARSSATAPHPSSDGTLTMFTSTSE